MFYLKSLSEAETENIGENFAKSLSGDEIIALFGNMGMGKTAFVRGLAKGLKVTGDVSSPTFSIVHEYKGKPTLYHFDMYRVLGLEDLYSTGFFDYINTGIIVIEWSENIIDVIPKTAIKIYLSKGKNENERTIKVEGAEKL